MSCRQQRRIKANIKDQLNALQRTILAPNGLEFRTIEIGKKCDENIADFNFDILYIDRNIHQDDYIKKVIFIKDKHNISDQTYLKLRNELEINLPSLSAVKGKIQQYDQTIEIFENSKGVYVDIKLLLETPPSLFF